MIDFDAVREEFDFWFEEESKPTICDSCGASHGNEPEWEIQWGKIMDIIEKSLKETT